MIGTATLSAPLVLAALGGLLSERAGVINIGLEGCMLGSACATAIIGVVTQNALLGLGGGIVIAILLSCLHALLTQAFDIDHIISGMAINALAIGGSNFVAKAVQDISNQKATVLNIQFYWVISIFATAAIYWMMMRSRAGLRLRAIGEDPDKCRQIGVPVTSIRYAALVGTGVLTGLSGALILSNAQSFSDGMTAGRGFIAVAALILGGWRPWATLAACLVFGAFSALQFQLQGTHVFGSEVPREAWTALPYLATLVALAGFLGHSHAPAGLGKP